jgi:hypothetical protein
MLAVMKDVTGKEISIGDKIVFMYRRNHGSELHVGQVVGFSPKMVRVEYQNMWNNFSIDLKQSSYAPHNIAITDKAAKL